MNERRHKSHRRHCIARFRNNKIPLRNRAISLRYDYSTTFAWVVSHRSSCSTTKKWHLLMLTPQAQPTIHGAEKINWYHHTHNCRSCMHSLTSDSGSNLLRYSNNNLLYRAKFLSRKQNPLLSYLFISLYFFSREMRILTAVANGVFQTANGVPISLRGFEGSQVSILKTFFLQFLSSMQDHWLFCWFIGIVQLCLVNSCWSSDRPATKRILCGNENCSFRN